MLQIVLKDASAQNIASRLQALEKQGEKEWTEKQQQLVGRVRYNSCVAP